ncbi:S1 family peptidase [Streptomyces phaeolivaceus]|uniref:S1 family peptidase n=1 Tax=Streptomyces phaeolivaceus TaxID=2653200 RepID=UPI001D04ED19|nr:trypsin-like serine protease [Streptomyces phaeolivaceus]
MAQPATAADASSRPTVTLDHPAAPKTPAKELRQRVIKAAEDQAAPAPDASEASDDTSSPSSPASPASPSSQSPFIIGGSETTISAAPWMVQLAYYDATTDEGFFCGGTLVAPNKVLTAAHCLDGLDWTANGAVLAGTTDLYDDTTGTVAGVHRQWQHPKYDGDLIKNDVAVLTLDRPLEQKTLRLAASDDKGTGKSATPWSPRIKARTGWKFTAYVTNGDVTGDAIADVIARDSGGTLWLYPGTNKASSSLFASRIKLGTGYNQYNALF